MADNFKRAGELKVGDKFKHVNRGEDNTIYVVRRLGTNIMVFTSIDGSVELGVEFDHVVNLISDDEYGPVPEALLMTLRHTISAMTELLETPDSKVRLTKVRLWMNNLKGWLPEVVKAEEAKANLIEEVKDLKIQIAEYLNK